MENTNNYNHTKPNCSTNHTKVDKTETKKEKEKEKPVNESKYQRFQLQLCRLPASETNPSKPLIFSLGPLS